MNRELIVAGNWKMHKTFAEAIETTNELLSALQDVNLSDVTTILGTPYIHLQAICTNTQSNNNVFVAAQNCHQAASGAYTGEISAPMLQSLGVSYVIIGHSERRKYFAEGHQLLAEKITAVIGQQMKPIFCCGEPLEIREQQQHQEFVKEQLEKGLFHLDAGAFQTVVVAYEPVWAIGTGKTATPGSGTVDACLYPEFDRSTIYTGYSRQLYDFVWRKL